MRILMKAICKPMAGILTSRAELLREVLGELSCNFGKADIVGAWQDFSFTDYYASEMGPRQRRCFVAFEKIFYQHEAVFFKEWAKNAECKFSLNGKRVVNIDPGYVDEKKLVLMSGKYSGHKIAIAENVFADVQLRYCKGWNPEPWTFPDLRDGSHFDEFTQMRKALMLCAKSAGSFK